MTTYHRRLSRATTPPPRLPEHYTVSQQIGFAPVMRCCCGATVTLPKTSQSNPSRELRAWLQQHDECLPSDAFPVRVEQEASA